jgi:hypothetical protein
MFGQARNSMKAFWLTYSFAAAALLVFCCSLLAAPVLCGIFIGGAAASAILLVYRRRSLAGKRYLIPVALVASIASVAVGFIIIFLTAAAYEVLYR